VSYYGKTRAAVEKQLRTAQSTRDSHLPVPGGRLTLGAYLQDWVRHLKTTGLASSTIAQYRSHVELHLTPELGRTTLVRLTPQALEALYASKLEQGLTATSVHHVHSTLRRALNRAVRLGLVARNVAQLAQAPAMAVREMETLSWEQVARLLHAAEGDRLEALYVLAVTTGCRQGELLALRWRFVDLAAGTLRVEASLAAIPRDVPIPPNATRLTDSLQLCEPKRRSRRTLPLAPRAVEALRRRLEVQRKERTGAGDAWHDLDLVFSTEIGTPLNPSNFIGRDWHRMRELAGLPRVGFHQLRHTVATLLLEQNVHFAAVSSLLGHQRTSVTLDVYSHVTAGLAVGVAEVMGAKLAEAERELGSVMGSNPTEGPTSPVPDHRKSTVN
jgi:integrase